MATETLSVPIFPLPNVVLFPETVLPLHIFEPRYKEMVADALNGDQMVGLVQLRPGWESDYYGAPSVYKILSVGKIARHERLPDGRYDLLLEGIYRAQILRESPRGTYRVAEVERLHDFLPEETQDDTALNHARLLRVFRRLIAALPEETRAAFRDEAWIEPPAGVLADLISHIFVENAYAKQSILSELDISRRLSLVQVQLRSLLRRE